MSRLVIAIPVLGIFAAVAVPVTRYALKQRHEQTALDVVEDVRAAQERFRRGTGGYASDVASLVTQCPGQDAVLAAGRLDDLRGAGYALTLSAESVEPQMSRDCHGRAVVPGYFLTAVPVAAEEAAQQAFAARASGDVVVFYDGVAPRPADIAAGLATPAAERNTFKIP